MRTVGWCGTISHGWQAHEQRPSCALFTPDDSQVAELLVPVVR